MAEDLTEYMHEQGVRVRYMHSDVDTVERIEIIRDLRLGAFDVLVGINLLREGLDIPECAFVGHPGRRQGGLPALGDLPGADHRPRRPQHRRQGGALRRPHHRLHGARHGRDQPAAARSSTPTTPSTASRPRASSATSPNILDSPYEKGDRVTVDAGVAESAKPFLGSNFQATLRDLETKMREAAANLEFETAARLRDEVKRLKMLDLEFANDLMTAPGEAVDREAPEARAQGGAGGGAGAVQEGAALTAPVIRESAKRLRDPPRWCWSRTQIPGWVDLEGASPLAEYGLAFLEGNIQGAERR